MIAMFLFWNLIGLESIIVLWVMEYITLENIYLRYYLVFVLRYIRMQDIYLVFTLQHIFMEETVVFYVKDLETLENNYISFVLDNIYPEYKTSVFSDLVLTWYSLSWIQRF